MSTLSLSYKSAAVNWICWRENRVSGENRSCGVGWCDCGVVEKGLAGMKNITYSVHVNFGVEVTLSLVLHFLVLSLLPGLLVGWMQQSIILCK